MQNIFAKVYVARHNTTLPFLNLIGQTIQCIISRESLCSTMSAVNNTIDLPFKSCYLCANLLLCMLQQILCTQQKWHSKESLWKIVFDILRLCFVCLDAILNEYICANSNTSTCVIFLKSI